MRILVAGSAGFIGYHLCERLLRAGYTVIGVDNYSTGQRSNTAQLAKNPSFHFLEQDITQPLPHDLRVDEIFDLACPASPVDFGPRRLHILNVCSRGVWNLLDLAQRNNALLLHASTSEVYGDPLEHPQRETYWGHVNPIGPRSCYDEGKRFAEALIMAYGDEYGIETRLVRIFNTYGPRMRSDDGRALPNFINQALAGRPLTVHGDGSQTRSFCYVSDLVDGILKLAASDVREPVNIGNPVEVSMLDVAREVIDMTGSSSVIHHTRRMPDDPKVRCPDITRARELLNWEPQVQRSDGFRTTIEWFRQPG